MTYTGFQNLTVEDPALKTTFPVLALYPTSTPSKLLPIGRYEMELSADAPIQDGSFPMVVISHGDGSDRFVHRTLGGYLAQQGYIVGIIQHFGNNREDNSLSGTVDNLTLRPHHVSLTLDALTTHFKNQAGSKAAVIGHSMGGYAALAVAGGRPWSGLDQPIPVKPDWRVEAIVLLAPATSYFVPRDSLQKIQVPILMITAEHDVVTPKWQAQLVVDGITDSKKIKWTEIKNAGHVSFISPFPQKFIDEKFPPAIDPPGFDRNEFHPKLQKSVGDFLNQYLLL